MGERRIPEVIDGFRDGLDNDEESLMKKVVLLINNEDYLEKDALQNLIKWRFSIKS
jgi:hypothetical protein